MNTARLYDERGEPRFIRCYETRRRRTLDRFTVVFTRANIFGGKGYTGRIYYVGMSDNPYREVGYHDVATRERFCPCGSKIAFSSLPSLCQEFVRSEYAELWCIKTA